MGSSPLTPTMFVVFAGVLVAYFIVMYGLGLLAQRRIHNVEDFLLAGRRLPVSLTTITIIATWFGAESLMTTADEVAGAGLRRAILDPLGISLCLFFAGLFVAGPLWRMGLMTVPDFFGKRYGRGAETLAALILVPSYFGWIAAQFVALAQLLEFFLGVPLVWGIWIVAILGTGYTLLGGMWTISWTDSVQMVFILVGLLVLGFAILDRLGQESISRGFLVLLSGTEEKRWRIADPDTFGVDLLEALAALAIGALGNLPMQDLIQRIFSAGSDKIAVRGCFYASAGYLLMGILPVGTGLAAALMLGHQSPEEGAVVMRIACDLLSPWLLLLFFLAVVSAVLSTIVSAVMAPAAVLAHNLIQPGWERIIGERLAEHRALGLQRASILFVAVASVWLATGGSSAYELVLDSYAMGLVGLFIPFLAGLRMTQVPHFAAILSMLTGIIVWGFHLAMGWELTLQPWLNQHFPLPQELAATVMSGLALVVGWFLARRFTIFDMGEGDPKEAAIPDADSMALTAEEFGE